MTRVLGGRDIPQRYAAVGFHQLAHYKGMGALHDKPMRAPHLPVAGPCALLSANVNIQMLCKTRDEAGGESR